jgi:serine/threonine-protein kinase
MAAINSDEDHDPDATKPVHGSKAPESPEAEPAPRGDTASGTGPVGPDRETLAPGSNAGPYVIERAIGAGGGGIVYAAEHQLLRRRAALKVLRRGMTASPTMMARFLREATAVNLIRHPNIVDIYEFGELPDGRPYYVMELLEGTDLGKLLKLQGRFSPAETLELLEPIGHALQAAHDVGIIHRDLKASNVIVADVQGQRVVKLLDFGIAKLIHNDSGGAGLTEPGVLLGSVHTMSPEQVRCEPVDSRSDIYSLGALLYQLLTGEHPFSARPEQVAWMHLEAPPPRPSQKAAIPLALDAVVLRCLEKDKRQRYQTVSAFLDDFRTAVRGEAPATTADVELTGPAFGCYIELYLDDVPDDAADDSIVDDMARILDLADEMFTQSNFVPAIHTSNAVLGVKLCPEDAAEATEARSEALTFARELLSAMEKRPKPDARIHVNVSLHVDEATVRISDVQREVTGGPLLAIEHWAARARVHALHVTDAFSR